jgi:16S rRNA (cytosine967-C5)-methyltransferase
LLDITKIKIRSLSFLATDIGKVQLRQDQKILASESGFDGFYMALLERKEEILKPKK